MAFRMKPVDWILQTLYAVTAISGIIGVAHLFIYYRGSLDAALAFVVLLGVYAAIQVANALLAFMIALRGNRTSPNERRLLPVLLLSIVFMLNGIGMSLMLVSKSGWSIPWHDDGFVAILLSYVISIAIYTLAIVVVTKKWAIRNLLKTGKQVR